MLFTSRLLLSLMWAVANAASLNAQDVGVNLKAGGILIQRTNHQLGTCSDMWKPAGAMSAGQPQLLVRQPKKQENLLRSHTVGQDQSQLASLATAKERSHTHIGCTPKPKQSTCLSTHLTSSTNMLDHCNRAKIVHWVLESNRLFKIVKDRGFQNLIKTGHLEYYIPSASTVSCDVWLVFARTRQRIVKILQVRDQSLGACCIMTNKNLLGVRRAP